MHGENGQYRPGLMKYHQLVLEGRGSVTDFHSSMEFKNKKAQKAFGEAWLEWVKQH